MSYKVNRFAETRIKEFDAETEKQPREEREYHIYSAEVVEGETIETKIQRVVENGEPITDGAPEIFTERKDGVLAAYNIKTDRWEIAAEAMDKVHKSKIAKAKDTGAQKEEKKDETKVIDLKKKGGDETSVV